MACPTINWEPDASPVTSGEQGKRTAAAPTPGCAGSRQTVISVSHPPNRYHRVLPRIHSTSDAPRMSWPQLYLGVALTTLATLMLELSLTRIFSVVFYYHFAFLAISHRAVRPGRGRRVFLCRGRAAAETSFRKLGTLAALNGLAVVAALAFHRYAARRTGLRNARRSCTSPARYRFFFRARSFAGDLRGRSSVSIASTSSIWPERPPDVCC